MSTDQIQWLRDRIAELEADGATGEKQNMLAQYRLELRHLEQPDLDNS